VGPPVVRPSNAGGGASAPALEDLVVVTWNRHLGAGDLEALVGDLVRGRFTDEVPVSRFVILVQEARRAGGEVPMPDAGGEGPERIRQDGDGGDVVADAEALGLSLVYVPSMRNGADVREDRGNAVLSTEPLHTIEAIELPFVRQRRVALGVSLEVTVAGEIASLRLMNLHLDARGTRLGLYGSPRRQQLETVLEWLRASDAPNGVRRAGTVLGGDLNTVQGGDDEPTYRLARAWSVSLRRQDPRDTHASMGRLDYLFFRLPPGWTASTDRLSPRYGSDHHPVMGRFTPP
jgi:endonuclease/exonuclease/phosphatase family metal-dependent hydrolase